MSRLMLVLILHIFIGSTLAGSAVIFSLTLGYDTLMPIIVAACIGFFGAFPVSVYVAKQITKVVQTRGKKRGKKVSRVILTLFG